MAVMAFVPTCCQTQLTSESACKRCYWAANSRHIKAVYSDSWCNLLCRRFREDAKWEPFRVSDADDDDDTEAHRISWRSCLLTSARCVSWHRVIHASRWCRAVINASVSRAPTKCTTKDAGTLLSSLPHAYQRVAASVLTWLTRELVFRGAVTKNNIRHLNIMFITVLDYECHI